MTPASLGQRFIAYLIDWFICSVLFYSVGSFLGIYGSILIVFLYSGFCYQKWSATLGKQLLGLRLQITKPLSMGGFIQAGLRDSLGRVISAALLGLGYLIAFLRDDKKALHDLLFSTRVVKADTSASPT